MNFERSSLRDFAVGEILLMDVVRNRVNLHGFTVWMKHPPGGGVNSSIDAIFFLFQDSPALLKTVLALYQ